MANMLKSFLGYLKLGDDEEYEDYIDDYEEQQRDRSARRTEKADRMDQPELESIERRFTKREKPFKMEEEMDAAPKKERAPRMERTTNNKIVPIRTTPKGLEVCIMKPTSFEDSQDICDMLLTGRAAVVNLEGFDPDDAQRIMDFISGSVYAINGNLHQISKYIFIFSPDTIDISGDYLDLMPMEGFEVPTLNKEF
jgi:cell division inhibitor SepF